VLCWWGYGSSSLVSLSKRPSFPPVLTRRTHHIVDFPIHISTCLARQSRHHAYHLLTSFTSSNTCMRQDASNVLFDQTRLVAAGLVHARFSCTERPRICHRWRFWWLSLVLETMYKQRRNSNANEAIHVSCAELILQAYHGVFKRCDAMLCLHAVHACKYQQHRRVRHELLNSREHRSKQEC
jgi:hypothetical protein